MKNLVLFVVGGLCLAGVAAASATPVVGGTSRAEAIPGQYIVVLKDGSDSATVAAKHEVKYGADVSHVYRYAFKGYAAKLSASALSALTADKDVRSVTEDGEFSAASTCTGADGSASPGGLYATQCLPTGIDRIDADRSTARSGDGRRSVDVDVAVLDTGIDLNHPDLNVVGGKDCVGSGKRASFDDPDYHGTHVAGTIGALDNGIGVVGVAPGARLWAVRVLDERGIGSKSTIICGIDFVTSTRLDADPANDVAVANMSILGKGSDDGGCGQTNDALHVAICNSVAAGVTYAVAAGNRPIDFQGGVPAAYDEVLTATAVTDLDGRPGGLDPRNSCPISGPPPIVDDTVASFSAFATLPTDQAHTIAAPGVCITSTLASPGPFGNDPNGLFGNDAGTSMAAPHVSGTVALCIASGGCAGLTPLQIIQKIRSDAAAYNGATPGYGFEGDPFRPISGRYYGYLIRAGLY
jgi:subtilisin family serine protease